MSLNVHLRMIKMVIVCYVYFITIFQKAAVTRDPLE